MPEPFHTYIHVFVGKGTAFEGREGVEIPKDFPDGVSRTILLVEGGTAVPWTNPEEIWYSPDWPLPALSNVRGDFFIVAMADCSVRAVDKRISEATLRAAITRNGHEKLGPDWDN
jgi:hypothetical protein